MERNLTSQKNLLTWRGLVKCKNISEQLVESTDYKLASFNLLIVYISGLSLTFLCIS